MIASIWLTAAALYVVFLYWYNNWSGPILGQEIDAISTIFPLVQVLNTPT